MLCLLHTHLDFFVVPPRNDWKWFGCSFKKEKRSWGFVLKFISNYIKVKQLIPIITPIITVKNVINSIMILIVPKINFYILFSYHTLFSIIFSGLAWYSFVIFGLRVSLCDLQMCAMCVGFPKWTEGQRRVGKTFFPLYQPLINDSICSIFCFKYSFKLFLYMSFS